MTGFTGLNKKFIFSQFWRLESISVSLTRHDRGLDLARGLKMGENDQIQCPSKSEESSPAILPPRSNVNSEQDQEVAGTSSVSRDTLPAGEEPCLLLSLAEHKHLWGGTMAGAMSLIIISHTSFLRRHPGESVFVNGRGWAARECWTSGRG